jgi:hypothetical protein
MEQSRTGLGKPGLVPGKPGQHKTVPGMKELGRPGQGQRTTVGKRELGPGTLEQGLGRLVQRTKERRTTVLGPSRTGQRRMVPGTSGLVLSRTGPGRSTTEPSTKEQRTTAPGPSRTVLGTSEPGLSRMGLGRSMTEPSKTGLRMTGLVLSRTVLGTSEPGLSMKALDKMEQRTTALDKTVLVPNTTVLRTIWRHRKEPHMLPGRCTMPVSRRHRSHTERC